MGLPCPCKAMQNQPFTLNQLVDIYSLYSYKGEIESCFLVTTKVIDLSEEAVKFEYHSNYWCDDKTMWLAKSELKPLDRESENQAVSLPNFLVISNKLNYSEYWSERTPEYEST